MYSRTQNENGTYNTRCLDCFMTVASAVETEAELRLVEVRHICPEKALADLLAKEKSIVAGAHPSQGSVDASFVRGSQDRSLRQGRPGL
ncbi:MAG: hypothetical protein ABSE99_09310 [Terracidiphilus sp.]|jgi:hypothetical protein